jgi:predicted transcriptional regulator
MKLEKKVLAIELRKEGLSLKQIASQLNVSKSSVSIWVRNIVLSHEQKMKLSPSLGGNTYTRDHFQKIRKEYQKEGRELIKNCNKEFIAGLMLFWAEGSKDRGSVIFSNSNPHMIKFFLNFLCKYFNIDKNIIAFSFQWYSGNSLTFLKVRDFWLDTLGLTEKNLRRCYVDNRYPMAPGRKKDKLMYGVGRLRINDVRIKQMLFGAIQEYIGFNNPEWD